MERVKVTALIALVLLFGIFIGQTAMQPRAASVGTTIAAPAAEPTPQPAALSPYERGQLITNCYMAAAQGKAFSPALNVPVSQSPQACLDQIRTLP